MPEVRVTVDKNTIHYDDGIVDKHSHGYNECAEGYALQCGAEVLEYWE